jgi:hypothetical protein
VAVAYSRRAAIRASALVFVALPTIVIAPASAGQPDSGVRGNVLYGPTCPVQRVGQACTRPYQATIVIRDAHGRRVLARTRSSADGYFSVGLRPGRYLLVPSSGRPYPRSQPRTVVVRPHRFTYVKITYDSGIR